MFWIWLAVAGLGLVSPSFGLNVRADTVPPTTDPFYATPSNISQYNPGDVIASRNISTDLNGILGGSLTDISLAGAYQFLYRTVDSLKNPTAAVTTVLVPHDASTDKLLSYQTAYDSANENCSPSYAFQAGANNTAIVDIVLVRVASHLPRSRPSSTKLRHR